MLPFPAMVRRIASAALIIAAVAVAARAQEAAPAGATPAETARLYEESARSREEAARIWEGLGNRPRAAALWGEAAAAWERAARAWDEAGEPARSKEAMGRFFQALEARDRAEVVLEARAAPREARPGDEVPLAVVARDREGAPVAGIEVRFEIERPRTARVEPDRVETDSGGVAAATLRVGPTAGPVRVVARARDLARAPVAFDVTVLAGEPAVLEVAAGDKQVVKVNRQTLRPLVARVTDATGNPVAGVPVRFALVAAPQGAIGAGLSAEEVVTGPDGTASVSFVAGNLGGRYSVLVEAGDLRGSPSRFDVTAVQTIPTTTIRGIRVEGAADSAPAVAGMAIQPGTTYLLVELGRALRNEVRRIFATGRYTDVRFEISEEEGQADLILRLVENPRVASVTFIGNRRVKDADILAAAGIAEGQFLAPAALDRAEEAIRKVYEEKGYIHAGVEAETEAALGGRVAVIFRIDERERVRISRVAIEGNEAISRLRIAWWMKTRRGKVYRRDEFEKDRDRIVNEYVNRGYLAARVEEPLLEFDDRGRMTVRVRIREGKRFRLGRVEFAGNEVVPSDVLASDLRLAEGEVFDRPKFAKSIQRMIDRYQRLGYVEVRIDPQSELDEEAGLVRFVLHVQEGLVQTLERIVIVGNVKTDDDVILREVRLREGEIIDGTKVEQSRRNLQNLQYFDKVLLTLEPGTEAGKKVLRIEVAEGRTGQIQFGAGFSSTDGLVAFTSISKKNFDPWDFWSFTGAGQDLTVQAELGGRRNSYNISWTDPWFLGRPLSVGLDAFRTFQRREDFQWNRTGGNVRLGWRRSDFDLVSLRYRYESFEVSDIGPFAPQEIADEAKGRTRFDRTTTSLTPGYVRDTRDSLRFPTSGYRFAYSGEFATTWLGGNVDFVRPVFSHAIYRKTPWFGGRHVLAARAEYSTISQFLEVLEIPAVEKFILGGGSTIRGYRERQVQIYDSAGNLIGPGFSSFFFNLEYRVPLDDEGRMSVAAFFDGGNVFDSDWSFGDLVYGTGAGIRFESPFGPLRLDLGYGLNFPNKGRTEIHFAIGQTF